MVYTILYTSMLIGFGGMAVMSPTPKLQIVGGLLFFVNAILFWR